MDVLVVDDDLEICDTLSELLDQEGHHVLTATGGEQALEALRTNARDVRLIILDLFMPGMDGWEFAERVEASAIPIVVTSGARGLALPRNAVACLTKPFGISELLAAVRKYGAADPHRSEPAPDPAQSRVPRVPCPSKG